MFNTINTFTRAGSKVNEDRGKGMPTCGFVIDGATGLVGKQLTQGPSDAAWLAQEISDQLEVLLPHSEEPVPKLLKQIGMHIQEAFYKFPHTEGLKEEALPSAGLCLVQERGDNLYYYTIGDCTLLIEYEDGKVETIYDNRISQFDQKAVKAMVVAAKEANCHVIEARTMIDPMLIKHRSYKNKKEGYYAFSIENNCFEEGIRGERSLKGIKRVIMMSDGFMQYVDTLHLVEDVEAFVKLLDHYSLEDLSEHIKKAQEADAQCDRYPRFKLSDDMTIVVLER